MTAFVEDCRREWKRLGVPDLLAEEMATELEADLAEAQADGVSAAEILGESDPRRFAATWASERGLVAEPPPKKSRRRLWIWLAVGLVVFLVLGVGIPVLLAAGVSVHSAANTRVTVTPPRRVSVVTVPNLVGLKACKAERIARHAGLNVHNFPRRRCDALVIDQRPAPGKVVPRHTPEGTVTLRLRRARR